MVPDTKEFYLARAVKAREQAASAADHQLAIVHEQMAANYAELARSAPETGAEAAGE
jgi:hypothetical protein